MHKSKSRELVEDVNRENDIFLFFTGSPALQGKERGTLNYPVAPRHPFTEGEFIGAEGRGGGSVPASALPLLTVRNLYLTFFASFASRSLCVKVFHEFVHVALLV
jgi:hypothetical protein